MRNYKFIWLAFSSFVFSLLIILSHDMQAQDGFEYSIEDFFNGRDHNQIMDSILDAQKNLEINKTTIENKDDINSLKNFSVNSLATITSEEALLEREALIALYNSTDGDNWTGITAGSEWKQNGEFTDDISNWYGIYLDGNGYVGQIGLHSNNLVGAVPPEIQNLTKMYYLGLTENQITEIPTEIGQLSTYLRVLNLAYNDITEIPASIGDLKSLQYLTLPGNRLVDLPVSIGNLESLNSMSLHSNQISSLPTSIGDLSSLTILDLAINQLTSLPAQMGEMENLITLDLRENQVSTISTGFGNMPKLENLWLTDNQLSSIDELCKLTQLKTLLVENNLLTDIPNNISQLTNLINFYLDNNDIEEIPANVFEIETLKELLISNNKINTIHINDVISSSLVKLALRDNLLEELPNNIGLLKSLELLVVDNNYLTCLPSELSQLSSMKSLTVGYNEISCEIPFTIDDLPNLTHLWIYHNYLTFSDFVSKGFHTIGYLYYYSPQKYFLVDEIRNIDVYKGQNVTITANVDRVLDPACLYAWYKDDQKIADFSEANYELVIEEFDYHDVGVYRYIITNNEARNLYIYSNDITLDIIPCPPVTYDFSYEPFVCTNYFLPTSEEHFCEEVSYTWDFGDGVISDERDPYHAYASPGTYDVSFIVEYLCDPVCGVQADTVTKQIVVPEILLDMVETNIDVPSQHITEVLSASASTFADTWPIIQMESILENKSPYQNGTMGVWRNDDSYVYNIDRSFTAPVNTQDDGTFDLNTFNWEYAELDAIPNWLKVNTITNYSDFSFELENQDILGNYTSAIYGYDGQLPSATGQNMQYEEMAFSGFEDVDGRTAGNWRLVTAAQPRKVLYQVYSGKGAVAVVQTDMASLSLDNSWMVATRTSGLGRRLNLRRCEIVCMEPFDENPEWTVVLFDQSLSEPPWGGIIWNVYGGITQERPDLDATVAHTGDASLRVTSDITHLQDQLKLIPGKEYLISSWVSVNDQHLTEPVLADNIGLTITIKDENDAVVTSYDFLPEGPIIEGWQKLKGSFLYPLAAAKFVLTLKAGSKGTAWYDDLRLHPLDGNMQTYVYEAETLRLKAVLDENNYASLYYYDQEGKLRIVKKETEKGIKTISESADHLVQYQE